MHSQFLENKPLVWYRVVWYKGHKILKTIVDCCWLSEIKDFLLVVV